MSEYREPTNLADALAEIARLRDEVEKARDNALVDAAFRVTDGDGSPEAVRYARRIDAPLRDDWWRTDAEARGRETGLREALEIVEKRMPQNGYTGSTSAGARLAVHSIAKLIRVALARKIEGGDR